jgi:hypothetical protein
VHIFGFSRGGIMGLLTAIDGERHLYSSGTFFGVPPITRFIIRRISFRSS